MTYGPDIKRRQKMGERIEGGLIIRGCIVVLYKLSSY